MISKPSRKLKSTNSEITWKIACLECECGPMYAVVTCYKCGQLLLAQTKQKTKQCPHCGFRFSVEKTRKIAYAKSAREASMLIRRLKSNLKGKKPPILK